MDKLNSGFRKEIDIKSYERALAYSNQEDLLINQRNTQILTLNGFLFAAYAVIFGQTLLALEKYTDSLKCYEKTQAFIAYYNSSLLNREIFVSFLIMIALCAGGGVSSFVLQNSVRAAQKAGEGIKILLDSTYMINHRLVNVGGKEKIISYYVTEDNEKLPSIFGGGFEKGEKSGSLSSISVSNIMIGIWIFLLLTVIFAFVNYFNFNPIIIPCSH